MVFEETITIECFLGGLTIAINGFTLVFDVATIAFNGFRWFQTIGQTMRWFRWIVVVYAQDSLKYAQDMPVICPRYAREICKRKLGQNVHQNSGVGAICPPSKILCDLGQNVLGQNVLGAFCLGAFCQWGKMSLGQNVS